MRMCIFYEARHRETYASYGCIFHENIALGCRGEKGTGPGRLYALVPQLFERAVRHPITGYQGWTLRDCSGVMAK